MRKCLDCPADISDLRRSAKRCRPCAHKERQRRAREWYKNLSNADRKAEIQRIAKANKANKRKSSKLPKDDGKRRVHVLALQHMTPEQIERQFKSLTFVGQV